MGNRPPRQCDLDSQGCSGGITTHLAAHIRHTGESLPTNVLEAARLHLLDTLIAVMSGAHLPPGRIARTYGAFSDTGPCSVVGSAGSAHPVVAALVNGTCAHADETDDSDERSRTHPGCSIVPAALAAAEANNSSGLGLLRAVALGYTFAVGASLAAFPEPDQRRNAVRSTHVLGGTLGSIAAVAQLYGFSEHQACTALSLAGQHVGGVSTWHRDVAHEEKAYLFGGYPASAALQVAGLVEAGLSGVPDAFDGTPSFFDSYGTGTEPIALVQEVCRGDAVVWATLKPFPVGMPLQAVAEAAGELLARCSEPRSLTRVQCAIPQDKMYLVGKSHMADIDASSVVKAVLLDGKVDFSRLHDPRALDDPPEGGEWPAIEVVGDSSLNGRRAAKVLFELADGTVDRVAVRDAKGTPARPLGPTEMHAKAHDCLDVSLGASRVAQLIRVVERLEGETTVLGLSELVRAPISAA